MTHFRKILHLDLDAFFCAVEELSRPELVGKPFAVGGKPHERGVVASCSYAARQFGVHSAQPMSQALRLCPNLLIVASSHGVYSAASERVMAILHSLTGLVEQLSIDEAFLDVSDLPQTGLQIARDLQARVAAETGLPCSLGVASNKLVAKTATDVGKAAHRGNLPPRSILVVPPGKEAEFLAPLPVRALYGVGPKTAERLVQMGIRTVGDLANVPVMRLTAEFGKAGYELAERARGIDDREVTVEHVVKSISQETTFDQDLNDEGILRATLRELSGQVGYRLRRSDLSAAVIRLKLRWPDFTTPTRQVTLPQATNQDGVIYQTVTGLFDQLWQPGRRVRLLGVAAGNLGGAARQLALWETGTEKERRLLDALDTLRDRFGDRVIQRASDLKGKKST